MYIDSMGCRVNGNILVPYYNSSRRLPTTTRHGGYKLFVSYRIFFDQLEIGSIPGEKIALINWRIHMVFLGRNNCSTSIQEVRQSRIECVMVAPVISLVFSRSVKFIKVVKFIKLINIVNFEFNVNVRSNKMQHYSMIWHIVKNQICFYKTTIGSVKSNK